jgi:hypothetical protein
MATRKTPTPRKSAATTRTRTTAKRAAKPAAAPAPKKAARPAAPAKPRPTAKAPVKAPVKPAAGAPVAKDKPAKEVKARKPKMVRDSFTMPKAEYAAIDTLKQRAAAAGRVAKKSELLRAGVKLLEGLAPAALKTALEALPAIKTGRPAKS